MGQNNQKSSRRVSRGPFDLEEKEMRDLGYKAIDILVDRVDFTESAGCLGGRN